MAEQVLDKGALALKLAYDLAREAFPVTEAKGVDPSGYPEYVDGAFWGGVDRKDEEGVKARFKDMAEFIGTLALKLEGRA